MTIKRITAELTDLSKFDDATLRHISLCLSTRNAKIADINYLRRCGKSLDEIERDLQHKIDSAAAQREGTLASSYAWTLEILKQMKEAERNDNA